MTLIDAACLASGMIVGWLAQWARRAYQRRRARPVTLYGHEYIASQTELDRVAQRMNAKPFNAGRYRRWME